MDYCLQLHKHLHQTASLCREIAAAWCSAKKHMQTAAAGTGERMTLMLTSKTDLKEDAGFLLLTQQQQSHCHPSVAP